MSLPIAGLMSEKPIEYVIEEIESLNKACRKWKRRQESIYVIVFFNSSSNPILKLTDRGLVDVDKFQLTKLWSVTFLGDLNDVFCLGYICIMFI